MEYTMSDILRLVEYMTEYPMMTSNAILIKMLAATEILDRYVRRMNEMMEEACRPTKSPNLEVQDMKKGSKPPSGK